MAISRHDPPSLSLGRPYDMPILLVSLAKTCNIDGDDLLDRLHTISAWPSYRRSRLVKLTEWIASDQTNSYQPRVITKAYTSPG